MNEQGVDAAYRDSAAARLLSDGLANAANEKGLSQRSLAKQLGYKQSVVLSHMALGRVPIPLERAAQLADLLGIDKRDFIAAVLEQRLPEVNWSEIIAPRTAPYRADDFVASLEAIAGGPLDGLTATQKAVMREVARDTYAGERWLSVHEVPTVALLRSLRPGITIDGLLAAERDAISAALTGSYDDEQRSAIF